MTSCETPFTRPTFLKWTSTCSTGSHSTWTRCVRVWRDLLGRVATSLVSPKLWCKEFPSDPRGATLPWHLPHFASFIQYAKSKRILPTYVAQVTEAYNAFAYYRVIQLMLHFVNSDLSGMSAHVTRPKPDFIRWPWESASGSITEPLRQFVTA